MNDIDSILEKLDQDGNIRYVRNAISELIVDRLQKVRDAFGYWEKVHFANAIAALAWNTNSSFQPATSWLRLCLVNVEKALVPAEQRNENYTPRDSHLDSLTYDQLMNAIVEVRSGN